MLDLQGGACALCRATPDYELYVDHNHDTGCVRSLLCAGCNNIIGALDALSWEDLMTYWGYAKHHDEGMDLAWRALAIACREIGNTPDPMIEHENGSN